MFSYRKYYSLFPCCQDWTCNLQMISLKSVFDQTPISYCPICSVGQFRMNFGTYKPNVAINLLNTAYYYYIELISNVLLWTPSYGRAKAVQPAQTDIQELSEDTGCSPEDHPEAMNNREEWRERVRDIHTGSTTWWWWWLLCTIFILACFFGGEVGVDIRQTDYDDENIIILPADKDNA